MIRAWRTALVMAGAAMVGALAFAGPALADVTVTPSEAPRGGPAELTFHVLESRPGAYATQIELDLPEVNPIAEIYPMSADDWAPRVVTRRLDRPVELIHGTTTTEVVSKIIWLRVTSPPADPAKPVELRVSLGPMPQGDRVSFTVVQTYSDGTVVRWADQPTGSGGKPALVVTLVDPVPGRNAHGMGHGTAGNPGGSSNTTSASDSGGSDGLSRILAAGLLVGLAVGIGVGGWLIVGTARRDATNTSQAFEANLKTDDTKAEAPAGTATGPG